MSAGYIKYSLNKNKEKYVLKILINNKLKKIQNKMNSNIVDLNNAKNKKQITDAFVNITTTIDDFKKLNKKYNLGLKSEFTYIPHGSNLSFTLDDKTQIKKLQEFLLKNIDEKSKKSSNQIESKLSEKLYNEDTNIEDRLKKQDIQFERMKNAQTLIQEEKYDEAISILEHIMFKEGLVVNGVSWPFILADAYYKSKSFDKCWQYLQFLEDKFPIHNSKIHSFRAKVRKKEKGWHDALYYTILSLTYNYATLSETAIEKELTPLLNKINLDIKDEILTLLKFAIETKKDGRANEIEIRKVFKEIVGK
ncbi:MAG: hypothetical protein GX879_02495 [Bacteroidales bacterium]|nr:hypothetical protein [Bacteroidales bacterium]